MTLFKENREKSGIKKLKMIRKNGRKREKNPKGWQKRIRIRKIDSLLQIKPQINPINLSQNRVNLLLNA